jgi:cell division protein FtsL
MPRAAAARALPAPARPRAQPRPKTRAAPRSAPRRRVAGGVVWIGAVALLLAGVVALNVAVLRLNVRLDDLGRERAKLRADNAQLSSEIAGRAASGRIVTLAIDKLGLAPASPESWTYLDVRK